MEPSNTGEEIKDGPFEWKNGRITFQEPVSTLLEISSFKVALLVWNGCVSHAETKNIRYYDDSISYGNLPFATTENYLDESKALLANLKTPRSIEKIITIYLDKICRHIDGWVRFLRYRVFSLFDEKYCILLVKPEWLFWSQNCEIDYEKTASNMLSSTELSEIQKFIIMCKFCRVDMLTTILLNSLSSYFIKSVTFDEDPVVFYWICYLRNELDRIPLHNSTSVDALMARLHRPNIFEFEYFWNRLNSNEQVIEITDRIKTTPQFGYVLLAKFLPKMTQHQQYQVFCDEPVPIVKNFWVVLHKPKLAVSIWLRFKDQYTDDQFIELVRKMLHTYIITSEEDMQLFVDLWEATPSYLKQQVTQIPVSSVMKAFCRHRNHSPSSLKFLYNYLTLSSVSDRKMAMQQISSKLSTHFTHSIRIVDVINLCYPIDDERAEYLKPVLNLKSTQKRGLYLMRHEKFDSLSLMLKIVSPNASATREFVGGLLKFAEKWINIIIEVSDERGSIGVYIEKWKFVVNHGKWRELSKFIDETCASDDPFWVPNIKKQFVSLFASAAGFFWHIDHLDELSKVVEEVFTLEEAQVFKNTLLDTFKREIITQFRYWKMYDEGNFVEFVSWCLGDSSKVEDFKSTLARGDIVDGMFCSTLQALSENNLSEYFEVLNKCLGFFWSVDEAKKYKIHKIYEFDGEIVLLMMFQPNMVKNLALILQHVFDNDADEMGKWRLSKQKNLGKRKLSDDGYNDADEMGKWRLSKQKNLGKRKLSNDGYESDYAPKFHYYEFTDDEDEGDFHFHFYSDDYDYDDLEYSRYKHTPYDEKDLPYLTVH